MNEKKEDEWTDEEIIAEALQHYWKDDEEGTMFPSKSSCYVSHGRAYIRNSNEILAVYKFEIKEENITFQ